MKAVVAVIAVGLTGLTSSALLPKKSATWFNFIGTCRRNQPEFDSCVLSSVQKVFPYLVKGIPELDLPSLDPLYTDELVTKYENGYAEAIFAMRDIVTHGLSELEFLEFRTNFSDPDNIKIQADVAIPELSSEGRFKFLGKFIGKEMGSRGDFRISMSNVTAMWDIRGYLVTFHGQRILVLNQFDVIPDVQDLKLFASDLFNGNEELTKAVLSMVNQNWRPAFEELLPYARESLDKLLTELAQRVFSTIPFDKLFPSAS